MLQKCSQWTDNIVRHWRGDMEDAMAAVEDGTEAVAVQDIGMVQG